MAAGSSKPDSNCLLADVVKKLNKFSIGFLSYLFKGECQEVEFLAQNFSLKEEESFSMS